MKQGISAGLTIVALITVAACDGGGSADAGIDAGADAGSTGDAQVGTDAAVDASSADAGATDAGAGDASALTDAACPDTTALAALTDGLFFTSDSDRPIEVGFAAGEGGAVTAADVVRLGGLAGVTSSEVASIVDSDRFFRFVVIDPTRVPPVPESRPMELERALEGIANRGDWVVLEVTQADGITVRVYVLAPTRCGDAIWLESVAIRT